MDYCSNGKTVVPFKDEFPRDSGIVRTNEYDCKGKFLLIENKNRFLPVFSFLSLKYLLFLVFCGILLLWLFFKKTRGKNDEKIF